MARARDHRLRHTTVLIIGWSFLEGIGAALIMPAIVALVASNFPPEGRPRAYGLVASAGAIAVAAGPLIGGLVTTYWTWRYVFAGEVVVVAAILMLTRRIQDAPPETRHRLDLVGAALTAAGLGLAVFGVLRSGEWGWIQPKRGPGMARDIAHPLVDPGRGPHHQDLLRLGGGVERGRGPLVRIEMLRVPQLTGGLTMFFFQFMIQAGIFFIVPLFLSVALGLTALETGVRLLPLSVALLLTAVAIPKYRPKAAPAHRRALGSHRAPCRLSRSLPLSRWVSGPEIVTVPMLLTGLGVGALASQLGAVTVSAVPDKDTGEVGGLQNTMTNLGASLGTALAGDPDRRPDHGVHRWGAGKPGSASRVSSAAEMELVGGIPFVSNAQLEEALGQTGLAPSETEAILAENEEARIAALRASLSILALFAVLALYFTRLIPKEPVGTPSGIPAEV